MTRKAKPEPIKYHRVPPETYPYGWSDLPTRVPPDLPEGSYEARRVLQWREGHLRDSLAREAFTGSLPEYEVGLRAAIPRPLP